MGFADCREDLPQGFIVAASPGNPQPHHLGQRAALAPVNLETSLRVGSKLGGHFVTGHVDGVGWLLGAEPTADSWEMSFTAPATGPLHPSKGSIAVNGVNLTVADCNLRHPVQAL